MSSDDKIPIKKHNHNAFSDRLLAYKSMHFTVCKAPCMISDSLFCFERPSGSFSKPISGSQRSDVIQALQPIMCGSEKFKCANLMSSSVSEPPRLSVSHPSLYPNPTPATTTSATSPPPETTFPSCLFHCKQLNVRSQAHQQLGPVSVCRGASSEQVSVEQGIMSASADCAQIQTSWPLQLIWSTVKSQRKTKRIVILFEKSSKWELQGFPFHLEGLQWQNNHIGLHTYMYRHAHTPSLTHPLGSGVNSSKATFDSSFFRQPLSLPSA